MRIVFGFSGGLMDGRVLSADSDDRRADGDPAIDYYCSTGRGEVGRRFLVPERDDGQWYEVVKCVEAGNSVFVRARHVRDDSSPVDFDEIFLRR